MAKNNCETINKCCFSGRGRISLRKYDPCCGIGPDGKNPYPMIHVGNADNFTINATVNRITQKDMTVCNGANYCSLDNLEDPNVTFDLKCMSPDNLAKAWAGTTINTEEETIEMVCPWRGDCDSIIPFVDDQGYPLVNVAPDNVVVALAGYPDIAVDVDYVVTEHGISFICGGPNLPAAEDFPPPNESEDQCVTPGFEMTVTFVAKENQQIDIFTTTGEEFELFFEGFNAVTCEPFAGYLFRIKLAPATGVPIIGEDFAEWGVEAAILKDDCKPVTRSQYGTFAL